MTDQAPEPTAPEQAPATEPDKQPWETDANAPNITTIISFKDGTEMEFPDMDFTYLPNNGVAIGYIGLYNGKRVVTTPIFFAAPGQWRYVVKLTNEHVRTLFYWKNGDRHKLTVQRGQVLSDEIVVKADNGEAK